MSKIFRRISVSLIVLLAVIGIGLTALCYNQHLSFYSVHRADTKLNINRGDLAVVKNNPNSKTAPTFIGSIPKLGYGLDLLQKPGGLIAIVYFPALLITIYEIKRLAKTSNRRVYETA